MLASGAGMYYLQREAERAYIGRYTHHRVPRGAYREVYPPYDPLREAYMGE